jgi:hypothetical protein
MGLRTLAVRAMLLNLEAAVLTAQGDCAASFFNRGEFMLLFGLTYPGNLATLQPALEIFGTYHG